MPSEEGVNAGEKFLPVKGFDEVVVGSHVQALHPVLDVRTSGQDQRGDLDAGLPESFNVLVKEMRSLGLNVELKSIADEDDEDGMQIAAE